MKLAKQILEEIKKYKGIEYDIKKEKNNFFSEIEGEEVEGSKSKSSKETDKKTKEYIDQVL